MNDRISLTVLFTGIALIVPPLESGTLEWNYVRETMGVKRSRRTWP
jgi:hypothetical protein